MTFCPNCNAELSLDAQACSKCGATFGSASAWKPTETIARSEPEYRPWKLTFLGLFVLADAIFVGVHQALGVMPLPSNYSFAQRAFTYAFAYTAQFLAAFVLGMVLSLLYGLIVGQRGAAYRRVTWMRALAIALLLAALLLYVAWWSTRH